MISESRSPSCGCLQSRHVQAREVQGVNKRGKVKHVHPSAFQPPPKSRVLSTKLSCPWNVCDLTKVARKE